MDNDAGLQKGKVGKWSAGKGKMENGSGLSQLRHENKSGQAGG